MVLGEQYMAGILRPPPTTHLPANTLHPFQKSFVYYMQKKGLPKHWYLLSGFAFTLTLFTTLDGLRETGKKSAYDAAVLAGKTPCEFSSPFGRSTYLLRGVWCCICNDNQYYI